MNKIIKILFISYILCIWLFINNVSAELSVGNLSASRVDYNSSWSLVFGNISNTNNYLADELWNILASQNYTYFVPSLRPNSSDTQVPRNCRLSYRIWVFEGNFIFQAYRRWVWGSAYCSNSDFWVEFLPVSGEVSTPAWYTWDSINMLDINSIDGPIQIITDNRMIYKKNWDDHTIYQYACNSFWNCAESPYIVLTFEPWEVEGIIQAFENKFVTLWSDFYWSISVYVDGPNGQAFYKSDYIFDDQWNFIEFSDSTWDWILNAFDNNWDIGLFQLNLESAINENLIFDVWQTPLIWYSYNWSTYDVRYIRDGVLYDFESEPSFNFIWNAWWSSPLDNWNDDPSPVPDDWTFTVWWYSFFESWFILNNFVPSPYGWLLSFDIIKPWSTEPERTETYWSYEVDGEGYWFDSGVVVDYPYHDLAWDYQVRVVYEYNWQSVFPFWDDYNTYTITLPEIVGANPDDLLEWDYQQCNDGNEDSWFLAGVSNFFLCSSQFVGSVVDGWKWIATGIIWPIKRIIDALAGLWWSISFNFIPSTYADNTDAINAWWDAFWNATVDKESNLYKPIDFMRWFLFIVLWLACLWLFILVIKD